MSCLPLVYVKAISFTNMGWPSLASPEGLSSKASLQGTKSHSSASSTLEYIDYNQQKRGIPLVKRLHNIVTDLKIVG